MRVLGVGVATLDIIDSLEAFPREDSEQRALARWSRRGGNTANTLVVLSQLGHACSWAGTLAQDAAADQIVDDLKAKGVDLRWARRHADTQSPVSHILLSRANASRTIIHYRDLPELEAEDFAVIDLTPFDWVHFEGRHVAACEQMLHRVRRQRPELRISLEVEKPRAQIDRLFALADVVVFSRAYASAAGYASAPELFAAARAAGATGLLCAAWGEAGGWLDEREGGQLHLPARPPARLVDTLGAGDVFNAGLIDALLQGKSPRQALERANRLAGRKCARQGLDGLGDTDG
jgi:ketohexokinase